MKTLFRVCSTITLPCLLLVALNLSAAEGEQTSEQAAQSGASAAADIFRRELFKQGSILSTVSSLITQRPEIAAQVVTNAIEVSLDSLVPIISTAIAAGATSEDLGSACTPKLTAPQIEELVGTAITKKADPKVMLKKCMTAVDDDEIADLITAVLQNVDPQQFEEMVVYANDLLDTSGKDGFTTVVDALIRGNLLEANASCVGECLRSIANTLVSRLAPPLDTSFDITEGDFQELIQIQAQEISLSGS